VLGNTIILLPESGISSHVWSIEELCDLLPENHKIGVQTDKALIHKALDNAHSIDAENVTTPGNVLNASLAV